VYLKYVKIMHLNIALNYHYDKYFKNNLEKYEIPEKPKDIDYEIKVSFTSDLNKYQHQNFEIFSKTTDGRIQSGIMISDSLYHVYILKDVFQDEANIEYVYMGVAFLKIALKEKMFPLHASTILYKNEAIAFSGPSKTGKSTHTSLWEKYIKNSIKLNDDKTMLTMDDHHVYAHGIPFSGAKSINLNKEVKLKAIVFLKQAKENKIYKVKPELATIELAKNIYQPSNVDQWQTIFTQIEKIINQIPIYTLACDISEEAVNKAYQAIYKGEIDEN